LNCQNAVLCRRRVCHIARRDSTTVTTRPQTDKLRYSTKLNISTEIINIIIRLILVSDMDSTFF